MAATYELIAHRIAIICFANCKCWSAIVVTSELYERRQDHFTLTLSIIIKRIRDLSMAALFNSNRSWNNREVKIAYNIHPLKSILSVIFFSPPIPLPSPLPQKDLFRTKILNFRAHCMIKLNQFWIKLNYLTLNNLIIKWFESKRFMKNIILAKDN